MSLENFEKEEIDVAIAVCESLRDEFDIESDEYADISMTAHYLREREAQRRLK